MKWFKKALRKITKPTPRAKRIWKLVGIVAITVFALFINLPTTWNSGAVAVNNTLDAVPVIKNINVPTFTYEYKARHILICYDGIAGCSRNLSEEDALTKAQELTDSLTVENFATIARENSDDVSTRDQGGLLGFLPENSFPTEFEDAVRALAIDEISEPVKTSFGYHIILKEDEKTGFPFKLGLDLKGGTHLVYEADLTDIAPSQRGEALDGVRDVLERRVNAFGISEPQIQVSGENRIVIELAGVRDVNEAIKLIGETPLLEFKEQNPNPEPRDLTSEEQTELDSFNEASRNKIEEARNILLRGGTDWESIVAEYSEYEQTKDNNGEFEENITQTLDPTYYEQASNTRVGRLSDIFEYNGYYQFIRVEEAINDIEVKANHLLICYEGASRCESDNTKEDALALIEELKGRATPENFIDLVKEYSTEPNAADSGGDLGYVQRGSTVQEFEDALFGLQANSISDVIETEFGYHLIYRQDDQPVQSYRIRNIGTKMRVKEDIVPPPDQWMSTELTGKQLRSAAIDFDQTTNEVFVRLDFNSEGKDLFAQITERNVGKPVAIFLDGTPISVPTVQSVIRDGQAIIQGNFTIEEAKTLAKRLNAGALPVPIELLSQQTVGATLGASSIDQSFEAAIIGLVLVIIFMVILYRLPGFAAVLALIVYGLLTLASYKIIGVVMTLSGIAGFILSIGMAVDANILIFERIKEELANDKPLLSSIDEGVRRAWPSIRDGNISTLITCAILVWFGTGIIKGFAITLFIGVVLSMFSAIIVTKHILKAMSRGKIGKIKSLYPGMK